MKRLGLVIAVLTVLAIVGLPSAAARAAEPIKIGIIYGLAGAPAPYTKPAIAGHELAVDEINASGGLLGRKLELLVRDDQSKPDVGVREARDLILKEKVNFLMGVIHSGVALGVSEVAKQYKVLFLDTIAKTAALTEEKGNRYVFRSASDTSIEGRAAALLMAGKPYTRYAVIGPDYEYGHRMVEDFINYLKQLKPGVQVVAEAWPKFGERDFTSQINALLEAKPQIVYSSLWGGDAITFIKQAKPYGFFKKTQYMNIAGGDLDVVVPLGQEAPEGIWVSSNYAVYYPNTPANREFVAKYKKKTGELPSAGAYFGYVGTYFLAEAIKKAGTVDTEKVIDALEGLTIQTPIEPLTMRAYDHQANKGQYWGRLKKSPEYPFLIMDHVEYIGGDKTLLPIDQIKKMRGGK